MDDFHLHLSKQLPQIFLFLLLLNKEFFKSYALMPECPLFQMHFQKTIGVRPRSEFLTERNRIYPDRIQSTSSIISSDCYEACKNDVECVAFVHILDINECYGYSLLQRTLHYLAIENGSFTLVEYSNAIFYEKVCLKVPENCKDRLWVLTKIPGNSLMLEGKKTITSLITRRECAENCLFETDFNCLSASFIPSFRNNQERFNKQKHKALGRCILNDVDKMLQPGAFRTAPFDEEYIENQCHRRPIESDHCSYELYGDSTFIEACTEAQYVGVTQKECQSLCSNSTKFYCQGASYFYDGNLNRAKCRLHSEDIISMGPRSLNAKNNSVYMRRVKCLNVQVICTKDEMIVKYTPMNGWFRGKIYTSWHSKDCWVQGTGNASIALHLQIGSEKKEKQCGILRAYEVNESQQRTFIATFVVIQNNPNVQTQGDRVIKVGCILNGVIDLMEQNQLDSKEEKEYMPRADSLESSMDTAKLFPSNYTTTALESVPKITLQVIDPLNNRQTKDVQIGQSLEFQIIAEYTNSTNGIEMTSPPNFRATSLIARARGTKDFLLLIDENGCPSDATIFPPLERIVKGKQNILRTNFHAFKFIDSSIINFDVNIQFCEENCPKNNCLQWKGTNSRTKRQLSQSNIDFPVRNPIYFSTVMKENNLHDLQLPLSYNLRVHGLNYKQIEKDLYGEFEPFVLIRAGEGNLTSFCFNQSLLIAIFIFVLMLIAIITFGCFCFMKTKRKQFKRSNEEMH